MSARQAVVRRVRASVRPSAAGVARRGAPVATEAPFVAAVVLLFGFATLGCAPDADECPV